MIKIAKLAGLVLATLAVGASAWAGEKLLTFDGNILSLGASKNHNIPMTKGHHYLITVKSEKKTASFDLYLIKGTESVAVKMANGDRTTRLRFAPAETGVYTLSVVAVTEPGAYKGTMELDED